MSEVKIKELDKSLIHQANSNSIKSATAYKIAEFAREQGYLE